MEKRALKVGDVVQIDPEHDEVFGGCLMVVSEPKPWGAQGYVRVPGQGDAFYRVNFEHIEFVGGAVWIHSDSSEPLF